MSKILFVVVVLAVVVVTALMGTLFIYASWNWGCVPAFSFAKEITLFQSFWFALGISAVGNMLRYKTSKEE